MKKISLLAVLCASCFSTSVFASWEHASNGGNFTMSGSVQSSEAVINPWVVNVGKSTEEFTIDALKTEKEVTIALTKTLPVIGVRTHKSVGFDGRAGITPQINFGNALNTDIFQGGETVLTMDVMSNEAASLEKKLGVMTAKLTTGAVIAYKGRTDENGNPVEKMGTLVSAKEGSAFFGGLGKNEQAVLPASSVIQVLQQLSPGIGENFASFDIADMSTVNDVDMSQSRLFSGYYAAGLKSQNIKITFDAERETNAPLKWRVSLPVEVTYL